MDDSTVWRGGLMAAFPERWAVSHEARTTGGLDEMNMPMEGFDLFCATPFAEHGDRVTVPGERLPFKVEGYPEDYNHGPFGFAPGYRINLVRVEG